MTSRNVAGSHDRCYSRVLVQLGYLGSGATSRRPRCEDRRTGSLARDLLAVVDRRRRSQPARTRAGGPPPQALRHARQPLQDHRSPTSNARLPLRQPKEAYTPSRPRAWIPLISIARVCRLHDRSRAKGESPSQWQRLIGFTISPASCLCSAGSSVNCVAPLPLVPSITGLEVARAVLGDRFAGRPIVLGARRTCRRPYRLAIRASLHRDHLHRAIRHGRFCEGGIDARESLAHLCSRLV
jgi:hypothetical protein